MKMTLLSLAWFVWRVAASCRTVFLILALCAEHGVRPSVQAAETLENPAAIQELREGKRSEANAAWWPFDEQDATVAIQAAIDSGAKTVVVPNIGQPWIVRPIRLVGNQDLVLHRGVQIVAKRGEFRGGSDTLFTADGIENLTIHGDGATLSMQKEDYIVGLVLKDLNWQRWFGQYAKAEWRSTLALRGCSNIKVLGLTLKDSGGDGVYIDGNGRLPCCRNILLQDLICDNHYRQGISVISVEGLTVEDCAFKNTWGTPPSSGVDLEPDSATQKLQNIVFRNCRFDDNYGDGIEIFLAHLNESSDPISILFEACRVSSRRGAGIRVTRIYDKGPRGSIEFRDCVVENTEAHGIKVQDKSALSASVRFVRCKLTSVAHNHSYQAAWAPIWLSTTEPQLVSAPGGVDFVECALEDNFDRPAVVVGRNPPTSNLRDLCGTITVRNAHGVTTELSSDEATRLIVKPGTDER
jgi:hypothetical protein